MSILTERIKKLFMITRYNRKWEKPEKKSCPIKEEYELIKVIEPISFNEDKTIKEYREIESYKVKKTKWSDFIASFDLGSVSEQVLNHLQKGTPLITAHTLPDGDYTKESIMKGAEIKQVLDSKGITLDMLLEAYNVSLEEKKEVKEGEQNA